MSIRTEIQIAAKLYNCQETAKKFWGKQYNEKVKWYTNIIKGVMAKEGLDELKAVLFISEMNEVKDNGDAVMMFMAAAVEMIEPNPHP